LDGEYTESPTPARAAQAIDLAIFDDLSAIDSEDADAMFDPEALASLAHEWAADDESLTLEQAENLGLIAIPENAS
jgi:hypothetical protein